MNTPLKYRQAALSEVYNPRERKSYEKTKERKRKRTYTTNASGFVWGFREWEASEVKTGVNK